MGKGRQGLTLVVIGSFLGCEAVGEIDNHELCWMPDHYHAEIPEGGIASAYSRPIVDSGAAAPMATGTIDLLKSLGSTFLSVTCPGPPAFITAFHVTYVPVPFRGETPEPTEPVHPPEELGQIATGVSASGAINNVTASAMSFSFEPPRAGRSGFEFERPRLNVRLEVSAPVTRHLRFSLPRARRNC